MALTALVTKKAVSKVMPKLWNITLTMVLTEDSTEVFQSDYSVYYRTGDNIASKENNLMAQMQTDIDKYKSEQNIFNNAQLDTVVTNINAGLEV
jgi:hypothetical protein